MRIAPVGKLFIAARRTSAESATPSPREPDRATIERFSTLMLPHLDVVHDAYARALNAFDAYRGGDAKAWLLTIVRNCFVSSARRRSEVLASDEMPDIADEADTPEAALARGQTSEMMRRLIKALPENLAEVIVLREVEDLSYKEIAAIIDAPIGTVMSRLARARDALAKAWREEAGEGAP